MAVRVAAILMGCPVAGRLAAMKSIVTAFETDAYAGAARRRAANLQGFVRGMEASYGHDVFKVVGLL